MNSKDVGEELGLKQAGGLTSVAWRVVEMLYGQFTRLWTPAQFLLAVGGLVIALFFGRELLHSLLISQNGVAKALEAQPEPTRSDNPGILAILLSHLKDDWSDPKKLNVEEVKAVLDEANATVSAVAGSGTSQAGIVKVSEEVSKVANDLNLITESMGKDERWQTAVTSMRKKSFVMVPAIEFQDNKPGEPPLDLNTRTGMEQALRSNHEILFDLRLASALEPTMGKMERASSKLLTVVQTYLITESGVFMILAPGVKDHGQYYRGEFRPYTQYKDRMYFWRALDNSQRKITPSPFDYASKPYLDLGGNGLVVTFSKKLTLPNKRVGVLCVDAKLPDYVTKEIEENLESLGAEVSDFYWSAGKREDSGKLTPGTVEPGERGLPPKGFEWFTEALNKSSAARSELLGSIATSPHQETPQSQGRVADVVRFTVPVGSVEYGEGIKRTRLLWVKFDSASILWTLTMNLMLFSGGIVLMLVVTWNLFRDYTILKREMSNVLEKMSKVMRDAPTPFVWLDENNEFHAVNRRMLQVLEYENIEELRKQTPTFRGLITDATQATYDAVLASSAAGQETDEYEIEVLTKTGKVLRVRAHGERIPYPTLWRRGIPHRFGIFVEVTDATSVTESEPAPKHDLTIAFSKRA